MLPNVIRDRAWTAEEQRLADYAIARGWIMFEAWVPEVDENANEIGGYWQISIRREKQLPDGRPYVYVLDVQPRTIAGPPELWGHWIELGDAGLEHGIEQLAVRN